MTPLSLLTNISTSQSSNSHSIAPTVPPQAMMIDSVVKLSQLDLANVTHCLSTEILKQKTVNALAIQQLEQFEKAFTLHSDSIEKEISELQKSITEMVAEIERLEKKKSELQKQCDTLSSKKTELSKDIREASSDTNEINDEEFEKLADHSYKLAGLSNELSSTSQQFNQVLVQLRATQQDIQTKQQELLKMNSSMPSLLQKREQLLALNKKKAELEQFIASNKSKEQSLTNVIKLFLDLKPQAAGRAFYCRDIQANPAPIPQQANPARIPQQANPVPIPQQANPAPIPQQVNPSPSSPQQANLNSSSSKKRPREQEDTENSAKRAKTNGNSNSHSHTEDQTALPKPISKPPQKPSSSHQNGASHSMDESDDKLFHADIDNPPRWFSKSRDQFPENSLHRFLLNENLTAEELRTFLEGKKKEGCLEKVINECIHGWTPLQFLIANEELALIKTFLEYNPKVDPSLKFQGWNLLQLAACSRELNVKEVTELLFWLKKVGFRIEDDYRDAPPMHLAANHGNEFTLMALVEVFGPATLNKYNSLGLAPIHCAVLYEDGREELDEALRLKQKASTLLRERETLLLTLLRGSDALLKERKLANEVALKMEQDAKEAFDQAKQLEIRAADAQKKGTGGALAWMLNCKDVLKNISIQDKIDNALDLAIQFCRLDYVKMLVDRPEFAVDSSTGLERYWTARLSKQTDFIINYPNKAELVRFLDQKFGKKKQAN